MRIEVDFVNSTPPTARMTVTHGASLRVAGWAVDPDAVSVPPIVARVDNANEVTAASSARPDVAQLYGSDALRECGYAVTMRAGLTLGDHEITLGTYRAGSFVALVRFPITVRDAHIDLAAPRILIAAAPKSGSTYALSVLTRYFATPEPPIAGIFWKWEQNLDGWVTARIRDRPFVLQMHARAYEQSLAVLESLAITPIVTWRNIADTVISYDDHLRREGGSDFLLQINDIAAFLRLPDQERYQLLIRWMVPWYVNFYTSWRYERPAAITHYEWLAVDPVAYFADMIERLAGSVDRARLDEILGVRLGFEKTRLNAGVNGRAAERMSDATKALLEELLQAPFLENLDELVRELPWNDGPAAVIPRAPSLNPSSS